jgi:hypothetical protein
MTVHRRRTAAVVVGLVVALLAAGCAGEDGTTTVADDASVVSTGEPIVEESSEPEPAVLSEGFGAGPGRSATPTPARSRKPRPKPTRKASTETRLPPAPAKPAASCTKPKYQGTALSRSAVKQALTAAAGRTYWPNSAPSIKVPLDLVKATAWQESGWQSNVIACDGGVGLMQVMPDTADYVNWRFEQTYDIDDPQDNATLGANYLAWLIKYFGDVYFGGDYTLSASGDCADSTAPCLLNAIISAYNAGFGAVDTDAGLVFPNPQYVRNVRALMTECECLSF